MGSTFGAGDGGLKPEAVRTARSRLTVCNFHAYSGSATMSDVNAGNDVSLFFIRVCCSPFRLINLLGIYIRIFRGSTCRLHLRCPRSQRGPPSRHLCLQCVRLRLLVLYAKVPSQTLKGRLLSNSVLFCPSRKAET